MTAPTDSTYRIIEEPRPAGFTTGGDPAAVNSQQKRTAPSRLVSLDAFRGFIMLMLAAHGFGIVALSQSPPDSLLWTLVNPDCLKSLAFHFQHPAWQSSFVPGSWTAGEGSPWLHVGVSFWDLIQPAFLLMVGVAMPFSYGRRSAFGESPWKRTAHALIRSVVLVLMGVFLYSLNNDSTNWIFPNVLAQIGLGYFFVSLLVGRSAWVQTTVLTVILVGTWIGIHISQPSAEIAPAAVNASVERGEIYAAPYRQWSKNLNAFHTFDVWFLNQFPRPADQGPFLFNRGGYQTLNFVPSMATMILGLICGQLLLRPISNRRKFWNLVGLALLCWGLGVLCGATCCPIVKRIWTPSWVLFSGGYVIGMLALFYLVFDLWPFRKLAFPLVVLGMNSILVYFLGELLTGWLAENLHRHFGGLMQQGAGLLANFLQVFQNNPNGTPGELMVSALLPMINAIGPVLLIWLFCWWLYRQRLFLRV